MKRVIYTLFSVVVWVGLGLYLVAATRMCRRESDQVAINEIKIIVSDSSERRVITPAMVRLWLVGAGMEITGREAARVDTEAIAGLVRSRLFVKTARVHTNLRGQLIIELTQRRPVMRVNTYNGYNFYVTDDNYILPLQSHEVLYVPVVTGIFAPPFGRDYAGPLERPDEGQKKLMENYLFLSKLINFVEIVGRDDYWSSEIVQINVVSADDVPGKEPKVEIVPRAGNHVVMLGRLDGVREKLDKLTLFYRRGLIYEGWDRYSRIDVEYNDQIVCTR